MGINTTQNFIIIENFLGQLDVLYTFYKKNKIHVYNATGANKHYLYGDNKQIAFGCYNDYFSLILENNFYLDKIYVNQYFDDLFTFFLKNFRVTDENYDQSFVAAQFFEI